MFDNPTSAYENGDEIGIFIYTSGGLSNTSNIIRRLHNSKLDLGIICQMTHYSPSHISHLFKKHSGMTINQYTNSLRIAEAKALLDSTELSVQEIALTVGFSDANYFSNVFRAAEKVSPREYRKQMNKAKSEAE